MKTKISAPPNEKSRFFKIKNCEEFLEFPALFSFFKEANVRFKRHSFGRLRQVRNFWNDANLQARGKHVDARHTHILNQTYVIYYQFFPYNQKKQQKNRFFAVDLRLNSKNQYHFVAFFHSWGFSCVSTKIQFKKALK